MKSLLVTAFANIGSVSNGRMKSVYEHVEGERIVVTTDFDHRKKKYYELSEMQHANQVNLHVPAYHKNLSLSRIWSHIVYAIRLRKFLYQMEDKPDVIYCTMPTSSSAYICARFCRKFGIKYVIDVIDLWPDSLLPLVKGKSIIKACLYPWTYMTRFSYKNADVIMGESKKYVSEAKKYNKKATAYPIYLGVDINYINKIKIEHDVQLLKPNGEIWIGYAGSLGYSYDFKSLLDAVNSIKGGYQYKLWFIGDGGRRDEIEEFIKEHELNAEITGFLPYEKLLGYLSYCDIAVNIFRSNTKVIYSYKFNDYVAMNCFVLNSLEGETSEMIDQYKIGRNFNFSDNPLSNVMSEVLDRWECYSSWKNNNQRLIREKLDKDKIYSVVKDIFNS